MKRRTPIRIRLLIATLALASGLAPVLVHADSGSRSAVDATPLAVSAPSNASDPSVSLLLLSPEKTNASPLLHEGLGIQDTVSPRSITADTADLIYGDEALKTARTGQERTPKN